MKRASYVPIYGKRFLSTKKLGYRLQFGTGTGTHWTGPARVTEVEWLVLGGNI
jgi:hypothetical protein